MKDFQGYGLPFHSCTDCLHLLQRLPRARTFTTVTLFLTLLIAVVEVKILHGSLIYIYIGVFIKYLLNT